MHCSTDQHFVDLACRFGRMLALAVTASNGATDKEGRYLSRQTLSRQIASLTQAIVLTLTLTSCMWTTNTASVYFDITIRSLEHLQDRTASNKQIHHASTRCSASLSSSVPSLPWPPWSPAVATLHRNGPSPTRTSLLSSAINLSAQGFSTPATCARMSRSRVMAFGVGMWIQLMFSVSFVARFILSGFVADEAMQEHSVTRSVGTWAVGWRMRGSRATSGSSILGLS